MTESKLADALSEFDIGLAALLADLRDDDALTLVDRARVTTAIEEFAADIEPALRRLQFQLRATGAE